MTYEERKAQVYSYLGKTVTIGIDRPIGFVHEKKDGTKLTYPINYGYIPEVLGGDDEELDELLYSVWGRASKWLPLALGVGRVYLVPYILGDRVYTDFVSQSNVIATDFEGNKDRVRAEVNALCEKFPIY